jgi:MFS family permease
MKGEKHQFFYGYVVVAVVFCIMLLAWGIFLSFGVFFQPVLTEFGWTRAATSGAYSLAFLVIGPLGIGVGRLIDRFGPRLVMTGCGFFVGLGFLLMSQISAIWQFYLVYGVIIGIGMSATFVPANSIIPRWFVKRRGLMTGIVLSGNGVGTIIMPSVARWLISAYDWRTAYIVVGIIALVLIILAAQFIKRDPSQVGQLPYGADEVKTESSGLKTRGFSLREAIRTNQCWLLCAISFCIWLCVGTVMVHIVIHATGLGISAASATSILVLIGAVSIAGKAVMGGVADRIGNKSALIISFIVMSLSFFWLIVAKELWMLYLFGVILGFAYGALSPLVSPAVAELFGLSSHGVIFGITFCGGNIGEAIGPVVAGRIFDVTGSYQWAFLLCAAISIIGIILSSLLRPTNRLSPSPTI